MDITGATFTKNVARYGGGFYLTNGPSLSIDTSTITNSSAIEEGGLIFCNEMNAGTDIGIINMNAVTMNTMLAGRNGGIMMINSAMISQITMTYCSANDVTAYSQGGAIYLSNAYIGDVSIQYGIFVEQHAYSEGAFMYAESPTMNLDLYRNQIACFNVLD
jgi:hypothetical protein